MNILNEKQAALLSGFIFGVGLVVAGMTQPHKVVNFLDLFGNWDPSLIFVMGGAVMLHSVTYYLTRKQSKPLLVTQWHVPTKTQITKPLMIGAILFGMGWGLAGYCPGPALVSLVSLNLNSILFVSAMLIGMGIFKLLDRKFRFNR